MRHRNVGLKLNRSSSHRNAMFRNMVTSLLKHECIRTTDVKAKEVRRWADHLITLAKRGDLHARRQAMAIVYEKDVVHKLFEEVNAKFGNRQGGYTRIVKLGFRAGDAAPISMIELICDAPATKSTKKTTKTKTKTTAPVATVSAEAESKAVVESVAVEPEVNEVDMDASVETLHDVKDADGVEDEPKIEASQKIADSAVVENVAVKETDVAVEKVVEKKEDVN